MNQVNQFEVQHADSDTLNQQNQNIAISSNKLNMSAQSLREPGIISQDNYSLNMTNDATAGVEPTKNLIASKNLIMAQFMEYLSGKEQHQQQQPSQQGSDQNQKIIQKFNFGIKKSQVKHQHMRRRSQFLSNKDSSTSLPLVQKFRGQVLNDEAKGCFDKLFYNSDDAYQRVEQNTGSSQNVQTKKFVEIKNLQKYVEEFNEQLQQANQNINRNNNQSLQSDCKLSESSHGTHYQSQRSIDFENTNQNNNQTDILCHLCDECQSVQVRLKIPKEFHFGVLAPQNPQEQVNRQLVYEFHQRDRANSDFSYHNFIKENEQFSNNKINDYSLDNTDEDILPMDQSNCQYDDIETGYKDTNQQCKNCGVFTINNPSFQGQMAVNDRSRGRPKQFAEVGPFQQVTTGHRIYMIPDYSSSQFNVSQEIFQNIDSSDDNFFNEFSDTKEYDYEEYESSSSQDAYFSDDSSYNDFMSRVFVEGRNQRSQSSMSSENKKAVIVLLMLFIYGLVMLYVSVYHPEIFRSSKSESSCSGSSCHSTHLQKPVKIDEFSRENEAEFSFGAI